MKKSTLVNIAMVVISIFLTLTVLEVVIEKNLLTQTPIKFHFALPSALEVLAQSSKTQRLPEHYIALAGDSYAQGKGDWLLTVDPDSNAPYHSAHVLQQLTQHDVITFGKSGASNSKGWVREPESKYTYIQHTIDSDLQPPDFVLAYFYAGNDLSDNVLEVRDIFIPEYGAAALHDDAAWNTFFNKQVRKNKVGPYGSANIKRGWLARALVKIIKGELKGNDIETEGEANVNNTVGTQEHNQVMINGQATAIPGGLQSPGLELDAPQTDIALLAMSKALTRLKRTFPVSQVVVVYVPAVIESYTLVSAASITNAIPQHEQYMREQHSAVALTARSDDIAARVAAEAQAQGLTFIDTRSDIRAASAKNIIHGPEDWLHFNRIGYEVLARSIACSMSAKKLWPATACPP